MQVKLNNIEYPIAFGMAAFRDLKKRADIDIPQIQAVLKDMSKKPEEVGVDQLETIGQLFLSGIRNGCRKAKQPEPVLTIEDMFDLMDDTEQFGKMMEAYADEAKTEGSKN